MLKMISQHRSLIEQRSRQLLLARSAPKPSERELERGIPLLLDQLISALGAVDSRQHEVDIDRAAAEYGRQLFALGFTVSEVVHGYGAVCEVVTSLSQELGITFTGRDFEVLNRVLDVAIAGAVTEYLQQCNDANLAKQVQDLGVLAHELRNALTAAAAAFSLIKKGKVGHSGRTADVLDRSLRRIGNLLDRALVEVRLQAESAPVLERLRLADVLDQVAVVMQREAEIRGQILDIDVDHELELDTDRQLFTSAVWNLVQNGLKYSQDGGRVSVRACVRDGHLLVDVEDECGGLPAGAADELFLPFVRRARQRVGIGLGLPIVVRAARALGGEVRARDLPGKGCIFTLDLPRVVGAHPLAAAP